MIDEKHVLPCDFIVGHIRFGKGVKLETVRAAAERWLRIAANDFTMDIEKKTDLDRALAELQREQDEHKR